MYRLLIVLIIISLLALAIFKILPRNKPSTSVPKGIYALIGWDEAPQDKTWELPYVDGLVIRTYWNNLNPQINVYNWDYLDRQFTKALEHHKKIKLMIAPGFYSPEFVFADSQVATATFLVPQGPFKDTLKPLPLPWNDRYLSYWFSFVNALAARYRNNPVLTYISITGPNSHNGEVSLPRETKDIATWLQVVNNNPAQLEQQLLSSWQKTITQFCDNFAGKHITLSLISKSLPVRDQNTPEEAYMEKLTQLGISQCPQTFGLQTNGLDGRPISPQDAQPLPQWDLLAKYAQKQLTVFQTRAPHNIYKCRKHDPSCQDNKQDIFKQAILVNGLSRNPDVLELYESDLLDPDLKPTILQARTQILR